ncbi:methyltransferase, partial [Methylobacterium hispanicum]
YEAYAVASGVDCDQAAKARAAVQAHLHTLAPETDAAVLRAGGFRGVELFFAAFTWRGWIGRA